MQYYNKYLKYKTKYLNLLKGGIIPEINCDLLPFEKNDINIIYQDNYILQNNEDSNKNYLLNKQYLFEKTNIKINKPIFNISDISTLANLTVKLGNDFIPYHVGSLQNNFNIIIGLLQYLEIINESFTQKKNRFSGEFNDFRIYISSKIFNIKENNFLVFAQINSILNCFSFFNKLHELLNYLLLNEFNRETIKCIFPNIENIKDFYNIYKFFYNKEKEISLEEHKKKSINQYLKSNIDDSEFYKDIEKLKNFITTCNIIDIKIKFKLEFNISLINLILINWIYFRNINQKLTVGSLSKNLYPINSINFLQNIFQKNEKQIYKYSKKIKKLNIEEDINIILLNKVNIPLVSNSVSVRNEQHFTTCVENAMLQLLKIITWDKNKYNLDLLPKSVSESIKGIIIKINNEPNKKETQIIMDEFVELISNVPNIDYNIPNTYNIKSNVNNVGNVLNYIFNGSTIPGGISNFNNIFKDINIKFQDDYELIQKDTNIEIKLNKISFIFNIIIREGHSFVLDNDENIYTHIHDYKYLNIIYKFLYYINEKIIFSPQFKCFYDMQPKNIQNFLFNKIIDIFNILLIECKNSTDVNGNTCLHLACIFNNEEKLREYIQKNYADINYLNNFKSTALILAIDNSNENLVRLLIENKADVNIGEPRPLSRVIYNLNILNLILDSNCDINYVTERGFSALELASRKGLIEVVKLLIERGADINISETYPPFLGACESGNHDCVQLYIDRGVNIYQVNFNNDTALSLVSESGDDESLKFFISKCMDVNNTNILGKTPIILACSKINNFNCVDLLIKNGADVNKIDNDGYTALLRASNYGFSEYIELLIKNGALINQTNNYGDTPIILACSKKNNFNFINLLIKNGADVNKVNEHGDTALIKACYHNNPDYIELLISNRDLINKPNKLGDTPILIASKYGSLDCMKILLQYGANINVSNKVGENPLTEVIINNHIKCFELLIDYIPHNIYESILIFLCNEGCFQLIDIFINKKCIDINKNIGDFIPLILVSGISNDEKYYKCVKVLINNGADVNIIDKNKNTALMRASRFGFENIVKLLINKGALVNLQNNLGNTALILAAKYSNISCVDLLLKNNADINIKNNLNKTALMLADEVCDVECIELLSKN